MRKVELPTLALIILVYSGWLMTTWYWRALPAPLLFLLGAWLSTWHGSLQHECIHGHPTRSRRLNALLVGWPLWLWLPYPLYERSHLEHHDSDLTDPVDDPESFYLRPAAWARAGRLRRATLWITQTMAGRLLLGPLLCVASFAWRERFWENRRIWLGHACWLVPVVAWLWLVEIPLGTYLLCFVYPGFSLTLLRSFAEHRPAPERDHRSVIVDAEPPLALLFLNNNLHAVHHAEPHLAWYLIPERYRTRRDQVLEQNGGYLFSGYREVARRFLIRPKDRPIHPE